MVRTKKVTEAPIDWLGAMLARSQLSGIRDQRDNLPDETARVNLSARETLILLCEREVVRKDHRRSRRSTEADPRPGRRHVGSPTARTCCCSRARVRFMLPTSLPLGVEFLFDPDRQTMAAGTAAPLTWGCSRSTALTIHGAPLHSCCAGKLCSSIRRRAVEGLTFNAAGRARPLGRPRWRVGCADCERGRGRGPNCCHALSTYWRG